ncbi:hypothetical protein EJB05_20068, partial [Eragrostis curvula]
PSSTPGIKTARCLPHDFPVSDSHRACLPPPPCSDSDAPPEAARPPARRLLASASALAAAHVQAMEDPGIEAKEAAVREVAKLLPLPELLSSIASIKYDYLARQQETATASMRSLVAPAPIGGDSGGGGACYGGDGDLGYGVVAATTASVSSPWLLQRRGGIALPMLGEMPLADVVWDEELLHGLDSRDGLLQQLAEGGDVTRSHEILRECSLLPQRHQVTQGVEYVVDEETKRIPKLDIDGKLSQVNGVLLLHMDAGSDVFDEMPLEDEVEAKSEHTLFIASVVWDNDEADALDQIPSEMLWDDDQLSQLNTCDDLLQQIAGGRECVDDIETNPRGAHSSALLQKHSMDVAGQIHEEMHSSDMNEDMGLTQEDNGTLVFLSSDYMRLEMAV